MRLYNVEVFDGFSYRCSLQIQNAEVKEDYLSPEKNKVKTSQETLWAKEGDYLHVWGEDIDSWGIVTEYENKKGKRQVTYESFLTRFDVDVFCDIEQLGSVTVENFVANLIRENFIENSDALQNIDGLVIEVQTGTQGTLDIEKGVCNLLEDVIVQAFILHQVVVTPIWDVQRKKITLRIANCQESPRTIEADLPNILDKSIVIRKTKEKVNKVIVYNEEDTNESLAFYLTESGEVSDVDEERILPVVFTTILTKASNEKTFAEVALDKAINKLKKYEYENLIELKMLREDVLVKPREIKMGQQVNVLSEGTSYASILTGREIAETETLIFGTVRLDLTKTIRRNAT